MIFCICHKLFRSSNKFSKIFSSLPCKFPRASEGRHFIRIKLITLHRCVIKKFFVQTNKLLSHTFEGFFTWQNRDCGWDTLYNQFFIFFLRTETTKHLKDLFFKNILLTSLEGQLTFCFPRPFLRHARDHSKECLLLLLAIL